MTSRLSIVIPTKNEESYLPLLLDSIKKQTRQPDEVIVADAHSDDRTAQVAKEYGCTVVEGGLPGPGRNRGAAKATGDILLFLDADVVFDAKDTIEKAMQEFTRRSLGLAAADIVPHDGIFFDRLSHRIYNLYARLMSRLKPHAPGFFMMVRKELHEQVGGFDETVVFAEDYEYAWRVGKVGKFGILTSVSIPVSMRRMNRDGRLNMVIKLILGELHMLTLGPIRHHRFNYTFGHEKRK